MSATFTTLFERSRYSNQGRWFGLDDLARKQRMEQQERFAVGMIGFALEHDPKFRMHFLGGVCGLQELSVANDWEVLVEPDNWGDLVLKHRNSSSLLVAEFKIGASLDEHQNPSELRFDLPSRNGDCAGYGWEIGQIASKENWKHLKYLTIEKKASWSQCGEASDCISCVPAEWKQFLRPDLSEESKLEADVYDCLGRFGVTIFVARRMKNMKIATHATQPLALLIGVLDNFQVEFKNKLLDAGAEFFGINIRKRDFPNFARRVELELDQEIAGWFGYESGEPFGPRLAVWFYCGNSAGIKLSARDNVKKLLKSAGYEEGTFREHDNCLHLFCKAERSGGDMEWFVKVLAALNN